jgi:hypothetical protein
MDKFGYPWFVAGGWAIDLFLGGETRPHGGVKIGIYRKNQMQLYRYFGSQGKYFIDNRSRVGKRVRREWKKEYLQAPIQELHLEQDGLELEVLLNEKDGDDWVYGGSGKVRLGEERLVLLGDGDIPYLCPEVVSLYKTRDMRDKDVADIAKAMAKMGGAQRKWLVDSIGDEGARARIRSLAAAPS